MTDPHGRTTAPPHRPTAGRTAGGRRTTACGPTTRLPAMANATTPGRPSILPGQPPAPEHDWPAQAADTIERVVGNVRDKTTGPALTAARAVVYGLFAAIVGLAVLVVLIIAAIRLIDSYLPDAVFGEDHMWAAYLIVGGALSIAGALCWSRRNGPGEEPHT